MAAVHHLRENYHDSSGVQTARFTDSLSHCGRPLPRRPQEWLHCISPPAELTEKQNIRAVERVPAPATMRFYLWSSQGAPTINRVDKAVVMFIGSRRIVLSHVR